MIYVNISVSVKLLKNYLIINFRARITINTMFQIKPQRSKFHLLCSIPTLIAGYL